MPTLEIVEILRPAEQGRTTPFLCRGEDEQLYYVKGRNAGMRSQGCEWMVAHLAQAFGLPVPPFKKVHISEELIRETDTAHQIVGTGVGFASEAQSGAQWFENSFVTEVPSALRRDVLVFDWWIQNMDRLQDNPNLLWDTVFKKLVVIDHDVAFEDEFWPTLFRDYHIFNVEWSSIFDSVEQKAAYRKRMQQALGVWADASVSAPEEWLSYALVGPMVAFDHDRARQILERCLTESIWSLE